MKKLEGPVLLIEDDLDDRNMIKDIWMNLRLPNQLICFENGQQLLDYLSKTEEQPFLILCNLHMPGLSGFEVRDIIDQTPEMKAKSIPFLFFTTDARESSINKAYQSTVQGYIVKSDTYQQLERTLRVVYDYWKLCSHPQNPHKVK